MSESRSRHPSTAISDPIVRVILSEALCPSRFIKVALSESLYPSRFIRVASSESLRSRGHLLAAGPRKLRRAPAAAGYPGDLSELLSGHIRVVYPSSESNNRALSSASIQSKVVVSRFKQSRIHTSLRPSHSVRVTPSESLCPSQCVRVMLSESPRPSHAKSLHLSHPSESLGRSHPVRVTLSESLCPSHSVRVILSESLFPSQSVAVSVEVIPLDSPCPSHPVRVILILSESFVRVAHLRLRPP